MALDVELLDPASLRSTDLCRPGAPLALAPADVLLLRPDHPFLRIGQWRAVLVRRHGRPAARLVASVDPRQTEAGLPVGAIGFVAAAGGSDGEAGTDWAEGAEDAEALAAALAAAERWLRSHRARLARCPMRLSTWFGHRTVTPRSGYSSAHPRDPQCPPFLMEPPTEPALLATLDAAGYRPAHRAVSLVVENQRVLHRGRRHLVRFRRAGFRDRPIDLSRLDDELALLHRLAAAVFRDNWGFADISPSEFAAFYAPLAGRVDPALIRFVERDGQPVGFAFAVPDAPAADGGRQFVFKTIGLLPEVRAACPGIGAALVALVHELAEQRGYSRGIHALMTEDSAAHRTSANWGTLLRTYATFERALPLAAS